jgi:hypothetical protein
MRRIITRRKKLNYAHLQQYSSEERHFKLAESIAVGILYQRRAETRPIPTIGLCSLLIALQI